MAKWQQFERDMCRQWSEWFSGGQEDDLFGRTPQSGGRATERKKKGLTGFNYAGDMMAYSIRGRALTEDNYFEFKRGYTKTKKKSRDAVSILNLVDNLASNKEPLLITWWKKLEKERKTHRKKRGFLVFKRDRKEICIVMNFKTWLVVMDLEMPLPIRSTIKKYATIKYNKINIVVCRLNDFFTEVSPKRICEVKYTTKLKIKRSKRSKPKLKIRRRK